MNKLGQSIVKVLAEAGIEYDPAKVAIVSVGDYAAFVASMVTLCHRWESDAANNTAKSGKIKAVPHSLAKLVAEQAGCQHDSAAGPNSPYYLAIKAGETAGVLHSVFFDGPRGRSNVGVKLGPGGGMSKDEAQALLNKYLGT